MIFPPPITVTINNKENFLCGKFKQLRYTDENMEKFYFPYHFILDYLTESTDHPGEATLDLDKFAKSKGHKGRLKNLTGYGVTHARHKSGAKFMILDDRESD